jgi:2-polyprenyl-3-methyl-5-hydroxy-6-metoxy-1,4-benzoquinol methylase
MDLGTRDSAFWSGNQPGFRFTSLAPGTEEFFREVERHRYSLEPHIPEIVDFPRWRGRRVLEVGCGVGTDGAQFARAGALYSGIDGSETAVRLARTRFEIDGLDGEHEHGSATDLPYDDESFDLVYSHGVLHHIVDTERAVSEVHRVLRPGGTALVMLYHRRSLNYHLNVMIVRRLLAAMLLVPGTPTAVAGLTGEDEAVLEGHRELLRRHGLRYLRDRQLFLSNNTDGPGNPLSKVYSRDEARSLFGSFSDVRTKVRFLNLRLIPGGSRVSGSLLGRALERRIGWHLYVAARR